MKLLTKLLRMETPGIVADAGHLVLRVSVGLMIFFIHGWHKVDDGIAHLKQGTPWALADEVAAMHFPAPTMAALAATGVQLICPLLLAAGLFTRINAALLTGVLGVAILQNVMAGRDPQLAVLYTLILVTLAVVGGGRFSLDSRLMQLALITRTQNESQRANCN